MDKERQKTYRREIQKVKGNINNLKGLLNKINSHEKGEIVLLNSNSKIYVSRKRYEDFIKEEILINEGRLETIHALIKSQKIIKQNG